MFKKWWHWGLLIVGIMLILACLVGAVGITYWFSTQRVVAEEPTAVAVEELVEETSEPTVCEEQLACSEVAAIPAIVESTPTPGWIGDDFGEEMPFPGIAGNPAIAELWNQTTSFCALVKINEGEALSWSHSGAWWQAGSQDALDARWPHQVAEYSAKSGNVSCQIFLSVNGVPQQ